uniref:ABC transmembrane type-1 domain-containing protein n=1 Tax=Rhodnius prolixus TaxID=13249 RepID=T1I397_RHOPR
MGIRLRVSFQSLLLKKILLIDTNNIEMNDFNTEIHKVNSSFETLEQIFLIIPYIFIALLYLLVATIFIVNVDDFDLSTVLILSFIVIIMFGYQVIFEFKNSSLLKKYKEDNTQIIQLFNEISNGLLQIKVYCLKKMFIEKLFKKRRHQEKLTNQLKIFKTITHCILFNFTKIVIVLYVMAQDILFDVTYSSENILMMVDHIEPQKINETLSTNACVMMNKVTLVNGSTNIFTNVILELERGKCFTFCVADQLSQKYLIRLLLGEIEADEGDVHVHGRISFCSDEPWLFPLATVRENITCGSYLNFPKFQRVIAQSCLSRDLMFLPLQELTVIGSKGNINITVELAAKISIARALYRDAELYIFDSIFHNLTVQTSNNIIANIIQTKMKDTKSIIILTNRKCDLERADRIFRVVYAKIDEVDSPEEINEANTPGIIEQIPDEDISEDGFDDNLYKRLSAKPYCVRTQNEIKEGPKCITKMFKDFDEFSGIKISIWHLLFQARFFGWNSAVACVFFVTFLLGGIGMELLCLSWDYIAVVESITGITWVDGFLPLILLFALLSTLIFLIFTSVVTYLITSVLVNKLQILYVNLPMWKREAREKILSCFKNRIAPLDLLMFDSLFNLLQSSLSIIGYLIFTLMSIHFVVIPFTAVCVAVVLFIKILSDFHLRLSELEIHSWNIVEGYFQFTKNQITSIRGLKAGEVYRDNFATHIDKHTSVKYLSKCLIEATCLWLSLLCVVCITIACMIIGFFPNESTKVGLTLYSCLMLYLLIPTIVESSFNTFSLILSLKVCGQNLNILNEELCKITEETPKGWRLWPNNGKIVTKYLIVNFEGRLTFMHFSVKTRELIGVTGAGSAAVLFAAYGLCETLSGHVEIDDKNKFLHRGLIPGRPFFFTGTLRDNLDPLREQPDDIIWYSLDKVGIAHEVIHLAYGLLTESKSWEKTFTVYQRQLLLLATAIASERKLVFLQLDSRILTFNEEADLVMKARRYLPRSTLFILSNRLRTILKCDRIIVYKHGAFMEVDIPTKLVNKEDSCLRNYVCSVESPSFVVSVHE